MKSFSVTILLLKWAIATPALASDATRISWATATKGGGFQLFGENVAEVIKATDTRLKVEALATKGSRYNFNLLVSGVSVGGSDDTVDLQGRSRITANTAGTGFALLHQVLAAMRRDRSECVDYFANFIRTYS